MQNKNRTKTAPAALFVTAILLVVMVIGAFGHKKIEASKPLDDRTDVKMALDVVHQRRRLAPNEKEAGDGKYSDEAIARVARIGDEQMKLNQFRKSEKPTECKKPRELNGIMDVKRFKADKDAYDRCVKLLKRRQKYWKLNNETREQFVFVVGFPPTIPNLASKQERDGAMTKFIFRKNLSGFIGYWRHKMVLGKLAQLRHAKGWNKQIGWIKKKFDAQPAGQKGEGQEAYEAFIDKVYLSQPLVCPKWVDGSCIKTWEGTTREDGKELKVADAAVRKAKKDLASSKDDEELKKALKEAKATRKSILDRGRDCLLVKPLAEAVTKANRMMHDDGKGEIRPMTCWRSNLQQSMLWTHIPSKGARLPGKKLSDFEKLIKTRIAVGFPGLSNHEQGLAMDVSNRRAAEPYLAAVAGMMCDFIKNDNDHCSIAEIEVGELVKLKMKAFIFLLDPTGTSIDIILGK